MQAGKEMAREINCKSTRKYKKVKKCTGDSRVVSGGGGDSVAKKFCTVFGPSGTQ